jgi:hypothetical protein
MRRYWIILLFRYRTDPPPSILSDVADGEPDDGRETFDRNELLVNINEKSNPEQLG